MYPFAGATKVEGVCENCETDLVMFVRADGGVVPTGTDECPDCETTSFRPGS